MLPAGGHRIRDRRSGGPRRRPGRFAPAREEIAVRLINAPLGMRVCYEAHVAGLGWLGEVCDGQVAGTTGQARQLEALRVRIIP